MKKALLPFLLLALQLNLASAQEGSKPWWNPFAQASPPSPTPAKGDTKQSSFFGKQKMPELKMPQLNWWSAQDKSSKTKTAQPSALSKMTENSKKMWNDTVDFLNPFDSPKPKRPAWNQGQNVKPKSKEGNWAWPWSGTNWSGKKEIEEPKSVSDFLRQPRPQL